jgi:hypothetical protein
VGGGEVAPLRLCRLPRGGFFFQKHLKWLGRVFGKALELIL